jgi:hypothetical protein
VEAADERLGRSRNRSARILWTSTTEMIGLHIPRYLARSEYYVSVVFGVAEAAGAAGYNITLITSGVLPRRGTPGRRPHPVRPGGHGPDGPAPHERGDPGRHRRAIYQSGAAGKRGLAPALLSSGVSSDWSSTLHSTYAASCANTAHPASLPASSTSAEALRAAVKDMLDKELRDRRPDLRRRSRRHRRRRSCPSSPPRAPKSAATSLFASCVDSTAMIAARLAITAIDLAPRAMGADCARLLIELVAGAAALGTVRTTPIELHVQDSTRWVGRGD